MSSLKHLFYYSLLYLSACAQTKTERHTVITTLDFDYLEGCETGKGPCNPTDIWRESKEDSVLLIFPSGGTLSDVYLQSESIRLHDQKSHEQGKPMLNLSGLDDGDYTASMISCGLGGSCSIRLKTKSK